VNPHSGETTSRERLVEGLLVALLGGNLIRTTLCLGGYRPETMLVTSLLTAAALAVHGLGVAWTGGRGTHWARWAMLPFLGYAAHNVLVITPVRWLGWHDWFFGRICSLGSGSRSMACAPAGRGRCCWRWWWPCSSRLLLWRGINVLCDPTG
jgi:hypothetical protein